VLTSSRIRLIPGQGLGTKLFLHDLKASCMAPDMMALSVENPLHMIYSTKKKLLASTVATYIITITKCGVEMLITQTLMSSSPHLLYLYTKVYHELRCHK